MYVERNKFSSVLSPLSMLPLALGIRIGIT